MAWLAQRLPVTLIPEQLPITSVWDDVVDHSRIAYEAMGSALLAQRVSTEPSSASTAPPRPIQIMHLFGTGARHCTILAAPVIATTVPASYSDACASGDGAGTIGSSRHSEPDAIVATIVIIMVCRPIVNIVDNMAPST